MAQFSVNAQRFDPYKNFKFRVKWDGRYVAGISKVGALKRSTELVEHREGGETGQRLCHWWISLGYADDAARLAKRDCIGCAARVHGPSSLPRCRRGCVPSAAG